MARVPCHKHGDVSAAPPGPGKGMRAGVTACVCVCVVQALQKLQGLTGYLLLLPAWLVVHGAWCGVEKMRLRDQSPVPCKATRVVCPSPPALAEGLVHTGWSLSRAGGWKATVEQWGATLGPTAVLLACGPWPTGKRCLTGGAARQAARGRRNP